jgi:hypothetical protein
MDRNDSARKVGQFFANAFYPLLTEHSEDLSNFYFLNAEKYVFFVNLYDILV